MKTKIAFLALSAFLFTQCTQKNVEKPPLAPVQPVVDKYFGTEITDPYQYLENTEDPAVIAWLRSNGEYANSIFSNIDARQQLIDKMHEFDSRRTTLVTSLRITENDQYFYLKTTPEDDTGKLFHRNGLQGNETLLFDPETFSNDSLKFVVNNINPSYDGKYVAFGITPHGKELATGLIIKVDQPELLPERINQLLQITSWLPDNNGFLYLRSGSDNVMDIKFFSEAKTWLHRLNTDESDDNVFFSRELNPELEIDSYELPVAFYDKDCNLIFGMASSVDRNLEVYYAPAEQIGDQSISWKLLFTQENEVYDWYANETDIYFLTPHNAPNFKLMKISISNPDLNTGVTIIPEDPVQKLSGFTLTKDGIYYTMKLNGVQEKLYFKGYNAETSKELDLPFPAGSIFISNKSIKFPDVWVTMAGWTQNTQRFRYDLTMDNFITESLSTLAEYPEYKDLVVEEIMVKSHDGVEVPLSIIFSKRLKKNGKNPLLLTGYGAYGIPYDPYFSPNLLLWCLEGGIFAVAHVRGGGELGEKWHRGGYKTTKSNTWKDFIACTEYMIEKKYTTPEKIAINGGSAGGILIGRAMTERPDLFAAAIPEVGVMNTVRTELEPSGPANVPEFGTVNDSTEFLALLEMDSYHHLKEGVKYPATLITGGMNDPRVAIWNPGKFAAKMQALNEYDRPVIFKVDFETGHGLDNTKSKNFEIVADILSFAHWNTGNKKYKPKVALVAGKTN